MRPMISRPGQPHEQADVGERVERERRVLDAGYRGHLGIEYEGDELPEPEGIRKTKALLERVRAELASQY